MEGTQSIVQVAKGQFPHLSVINGHRDAAAVRQCRSVHLIVA